MAQYQAGYFIEGIKKLFIRDKDFDKISAIMHELSFFELETENDLSKSCNDSIVSVFNNIITRGLPALPSTFIEDFISTTFSRTRKKTSENNNLEYNFINDDLKKLIYRALHIIEPRLTLKQFEKNIKKTKDSKENSINQFLFEMIPIHYGEYFLQIIEKNRDIENLCKYNDNFKNDLNYLKSSKEYNFLSQTTDFTIEIPYIEKEQKGIIIDLTDNINIESIDYKLEEKKQNFLKNLKWNYIPKFQKISFQENEAAIEQLSFFTFNSFFDNLRNNFKSPLYKIPEGLDVMQITLSPLGVARIEKTLVEFILSGKLSLDAEEWKIAVIERDIPCAFVAIEDLKHHFKKLFLLEGKERVLPKISLSVFFTEEFVEAELNVLYQGEKHLISEFKADVVFDLLIDISILSRKDCDFEKLITCSKNTAKIRSVKNINSARVFQTEDLILYKPIIDVNINKSEQDEDEETASQDALRFFLKSIFRKNDFLESQIEILNEALQLKNTVAVVPFTAGKTICYQLAAMLQPGISLIINPVMSVMKEQFDQLKDLGIDGIYYLNSSQTRFADKQKAKEKIKNGEAIITFFSADRLQNEDFRHLLTSMNLAEKYFAYTIIDEAHCMSEWSHDFREAYSTIPVNANLYCKSKNTPDTPIIAVTSYASYDVINDISAKLKIVNKPVTKEKEKTSLNYEFIKIEVENIKEISETEKVKNAVNIKKQIKTIEYIENSLTEKNTTLVICPDKRGLLSVDSTNNDGLFSKVFNTLKNNKISKFEGVIDDGNYSVGGIKSAESYENYKNFKNNEFSVLIANKSIGIGLNKSDLREIIHLNIPLSVENFAQINNRAGRDGKLADIKVFYNNNKYKFSDKEYKSDNIGEINFLNIEKESNIDIENQTEVFKKTYGNRFKDYLIFNELLTKITFPKIKPINLLNIKLEQEFNEKFKLTTQPAINPYQLHIEKENGKLVGFIDLKNNVNIVKSSTFEYEISEQILYFTKEYILKTTSVSENILTWLETENQKEGIDGIDVVIKNLNSEDEAEITINFTNSFLDSISENIRKFIDTNFNSNLIDIYIESSDFDSFKNIVSAKLNINLNKLTTNTLIEVNDLFLKSRSFTDSIRVVNKLFILNIINDYSVDFNKEEIKIKFVKKDENEYKLAIYKYLLPYTSKDKALKSFEEIPNFKGNSVLQKCIYYFNNFWYDNIVNKRFNSLQILNEIIDFEDKTDLNQKLQKFELNYFTSKYDNEITTWGLNNKTKKFTHFDFSIVEYYIAEIGFLKNDWEHLKKSTEKLLNIYPENYILSILNGYTDILLNPENEDIIDTALSKITDGFALIGVNYNLKSDEVNEKIDWIVEKIYEQNLDLKKKIEIILELKTYTSWLKKFNKKLLAK